jgi:histidyl-tRNA synthetase
MALLFGIAEDPGGSVGLKDLATGEQQTLSIDAAVARLLSPTSSSTGKPA